MTRTGLTAAVLVIASLSSAQVPPAVQPPPAGLPPPAAPPVTAALMAHLREWQRVMQGALNFQTECTKSVTDQINKREVRHRGSVYCMKPNLALVKLTKLPPPGQPENPNDFEAYLCDGRAVYAYDAPAKTVKVHPLVNPGVGDNLLLEFISGAMTADQVVQRFDIREMPEKVTDPTYLFLDIRPLLAKDKAEFDLMRLVLVRPGLAGAEKMAYLPRMAQIHRVNAQQVESWDFPKPIQNDPKIVAAAFQFVPPDKWKVERVQLPPAAPPGQGAPRVVRQ